LLYAMGLVMIVFSVFLPSLAQRFGLSRTQSSSLMTIQSVVSIFVMIIAGRVYKKHSVRVFSLIFGLCGTLGYLIYAVTPSIYVCYLGSAVLGIAQGGATMIPTSILLTRWFAQKRGLALGIATAGSGVAPMIFSPLIARRIQTAGMTNAFLTVAVLVAGFAVLVFLLLRDLPSDVGLEPYGAAGAVPAGGGPAGPPPGMTMKEALGTKEFYILAAAAFLLGMTFTSSNNHYVAHLVASGFSPVIAAFGFSIMGAAGLLTKPVLGVVADKLGVFKSNFLFYGLWIAAQIFVVAATNGNTEAYIFAILISFGAGLGSIAMPLWISQKFGYRDYGQIYSNMMTCYQTGITLGLMVFGLIADYSGTYQTSYLFNGGLAVLSLILAQLVCKSIGRKEA